MANRNTTSGTETTGEAASATTPAVGPGPAYDTAQPVISSRIVQKFWPLAEQPATDGQLEYRPALLGEAKLHFVQTARGIDVWQDCTALKPIHGKLSDPVWDAALVFEQIRALVDAPEPAATFAELPTELAQEKNYRSWERDLKDWLYQTQRYQRFRHPPTDTDSHDGETEDDFRARIAPGARIAEQQRIESAYGAKIKKTQDVLAKAESQADRHKWWWFSSVWRVLEVLLVRLAGGRSRKRLVTATSTEQMNRGRRSYTAAHEDVERLSEELASLETERERELAAIDANFRPETIAVEKIEVSPRKGDIDIDRVALVWLPWQIAADKRTHPLY